MGGPQSSDLGMGAAAMGGSGGGFDLSEFPSLGGGPGRGGGGVMPGMAGGLQQFGLGGMAGGLGQPGVGPLDGHAAAPPVRRRTCFNSNSDAPETGALVRPPHHTFTRPCVRCLAAQPNPEFNVQSEDFPALPGAAPSGGGGCFRSGSIDSGMEGMLGGGGKEEDGVPTGGPPIDRADRFGLMGLLSVIRMTDQDLNTLALGTDLTTLGLNLNSSDCLYATFASPWADSPAQRDPEFNLPQCYYMQPPALKTGHFSKFQLETLFYIFYNMPRDTLQAYAATELYNRDWRYHKDLKLWFTRASRQGSQDTQKGQYIYFDIQDWKKKVFHGAGGGAAPGGGADAADADGEADETSGMLHDS